MTFDPFCPTQLLNSVKMMKKKLDPLLESMQCVKLKSTCCQGRKVKIIGPWSLHMSTLKIEV